MSSAKKRVVYAKNPIYVFYAVGAILLFLLCALVASRSNVGPVEQAFFDLLYKLGDLIKPFFVVISAFGTVFFAILISIYFLARKRVDITIRLSTAAITADALALLLKNWDLRAQPQNMLNYVVPRVQVSWTGFPSALMATATATGLVLALYTPRSMRRWLLLAIFLVGLSNMYLGICLPVDVVAGYAVGLFCYSAVNLMLGSIYHPISVKKLTRRLQDSGMTGLTLKLASVDARGSVPFFGKYDGGLIFVKVFNKDNNAADWLFKLIRRLQYRRLEDEVPSLTPKRTIEHEAYLTILAKQLAGVRVPDMIGVFNVGTSSYAMASKRLDAVGLDKMDKKLITDKLLKDCWQQIAKLHAARIIHKDLRTANVMVENKTNLPWLIDFGFAESTVKKRSFYKDTVEFIASSATKVGGKRAVETARQVIGKQGIEEALPYMQYAVLSGATTTALKKDGSLLQEIREEMLSAAGDSPKTVKVAKVKRLGRRYVIK